MLELHLRDLYDKKMLLQIQEQDVVMTCWFPATQRERMEHKRSGVKRNEIYTRDMKVVRAFLT